MSKQNKYKRGRMATIESDIDFYVDEYLEYATDEALIEEIVDRQITLEDGEFDAESLADALCAKLSIVKAQALRDLLTEFMKP